jgi:hypothetical protein
MNPGDRVFVKRGVMDVIGYGMVTGDYESLLSKIGFASRRFGQARQPGSLTLAA